LAYAPIAPSPLQATSLKGELFFQCSTVLIREGRISDPAIRIRPDFYYPAKSDSGRIARFTPDRIGANYCVNLRQTICRCSRLVCCLCRVVSNYYSNRPSRQVRPLIGLHVPGDKVSRMPYMRLMFISRKLSHNRQFIRRPA